MRYIDFGNEEDVDIGDIHSLIGDLETLRPLCFKLNLPNVDVVKNSEKNKARVEKKLWRTIPIPITINFKAQIRTPELQFSNGAVRREKTRKWL